jgi:hypothetical protein
MTLHTISIQETVKVSGVLGHHGPDSGPFKIWKYLFEFVSNITIKETLSVKRNHFYEGGIDHIGSHSDWETVV